MPCARPQKPSRNVRNVSLCPSRAHKEVMHMDSANLGFYRVDQAHESRRSLGQIVCQFWLSSVGERNTIPLASLGYQGDGWLLLWLHFLPSDNRCSDRA
jgi:hypothetical protein